MPKAPPIPELDFFRLSKNHAELSSKLKQLKIPHDDVLEFAKHLAQRWFRLAEQHLTEASAALKARSSRAVYSRSYYAAYNASKAVRYLVFGSVTLTGDDHGKASHLPDDFPDGASWSQQITKLYENRLRADYDNWSGTQREFSSPPRKSLAQARAFVKRSRFYLKAKFALSV